VKYVFYLGHPAHFHLFKNVIDDLGGRHSVTVLSRSKDVLEDLLRGSGWAYTNVLPRGRGDGAVAMTWGLLKRELRLFRVCLRERPDALVGCSPELAHMGWLLRIPSIITVEDDHDAIPRLARLTYPFCTAIFAPEGCDVGGYRDKLRTYPGYHGLAYLHPERFTPDPQKAALLRRGRDAFSIVRLSRLVAHHDAGIQGLRDEDVDAVIDKLSRVGNVWISTERSLPDRFARLRLPIAPGDMHHALAFARVLVSDSQSMTKEAAVLGTPSVRYSDFVGRLSVLDELEREYGLTRGVKPDDRTSLIAAVERALVDGESPEWSERRRCMLADKVDVAGWMIRFLEGLPGTLEHAGAGEPPGAGRS